MWEKWINDRIFIGYIMWILRHKQSIYRIYLNIKKKIKGCVDNIKLLHLAWLTHKIEWYVNFSMSASKNELIASFEPVKYIVSLIGAVSVKSSVKNVFIRWNASSTSVDQLKSNFDKQPFGVSKKGTFRVSNEFSLSTTCYPLLES